MNYLIPIAIALVVSIVGYMIATSVGKKASVKILDDAQNKSKRILSDADKQSEHIKKEKLLEVKEEWHKRKTEFDQDRHQRMQKISNAESQLKKREENLENRMDLILKREKNIHESESNLAKGKEELAKKSSDVEKLKQEQIQKLQEISGLTREEAKKVLYDSLINEVKEQSANKIRQIREETKQKAEKEAQSIIIQAIQRTATDHSIESTVSVVNLDSDEMKGRIIGREGRNIRAFESATGIDLIIDDTPEAVVISGFDPFRREVAKKALEKLMLDGRIHPARIEEVVEKTRKELEEEILQVGENVILELSIKQMHKELTRLVGKMKYRSSYGQNLLSHSIEVARVTGIMAAELGLDVNLSKRAALLHDIGKCVDEAEGPHALVGFEISKRYKENPIVCNAIGSHHEDIEMESPIAVLVQAADSISGARPGARRESLETYIKRLEKLEEIATSFDGVGKTYAIQAGREVRVIVEPDKIDDNSADQMAIDIATRIESEMEYPGQIKVTLIREKRSVALAK
ncbi:MAG: ribonuclease Y [Ignavibacteria bacterium GWF2_33_9]|nr:MAG: ribonuclease Y [Ignavibacteria bacterium GWF2_33_9]